MASIGIMDPAFFVGKNVLLKWLNDFFEAGYTKVEQMSSGAMACQIMDAIYPGKINLGKVNFDAKTQPEFVANFKVLQTLFDKEQIPKHIDVPKLLNGKFQDNLEFLQWLKQYFDKNYDGHEYNAKEVRDKARAAYKKGHKFAGSGAAAKAAQPEEKKAAPAPAKPSGIQKTSASAAPAAKPAPKPAAAAAPKPVKAAAASPSGKSSSTAAPAQAAAAPSEELLELRTTVADLKKEVKFYFDKLREVEILVQEDGTNDKSVEQVKKEILEILYKMDDNEEFTAPADAAAEEPAAAESEVVAGEVEVPISVDGADNPEGLLEQTEIPLNETF